MNPFAIAAIVLAAGSFVAPEQVHAAGDPAAGKTAFETQCASCHTISVGKNGFGPSLAQVIGRKAGGLAGFTYSPAMAQAGLTWDEKTLDHFLVSSTAAVPGRRWR
jgi:cytochrome c2